MTMNIDIRLLTGGDIELAAPSGAAIQGAIPRALFAVLALNAGHWLTRDHVADLLWTNVDQSSARNRLRMALFNLRQGVGNQLEDRLKSTKEMLCLDIPRENVDALKFRDLCSYSDSGSRAEAIKIYGGDLLGRFPEISENFDTMLQVRRNELRTQAVVLLQQSLSDYSAAEEMQSFENLLVKALEIDRTNGKTYELAMRHFAQAGMEDRVENMFRQYEKAMAEDLDLPPSETIRKLSRYLFVKAQEVGRAMPEAAEISAAAPAKAVYYSGRQNFTERRVFGVYSLVGFVTLALALSAAWTIFGRRTKPTESDSTLFLVQPYKVQSENCTINDVSDRYDRIVIAALRKISGSNVVLAQQNRFAVPTLSTTFRLDQVVICSNNLLRTTVILTGFRAGDIKWVGRYEISSSELDTLTGQIYGDINTVLTGQ